MQLFLQRKQYLSYKLKQFFSTRTFIIQTMNITITIGEHITTTIGPIHSSTTTSIYMSRTHDLLITRIEIILIGYKAVGPHIS